MMRSRIALLAFGLLSLALFQSLGRLNPFALTLVLAALGLSLGGALLRDPPETSGDLRMFLGVLAGCHFALLLLSPSVRLFEPDLPLERFRVAIGVGAVLAGAYFWTKLPWPNLRLAGVLLAHLAAGAMLIQASPMPNIDVWHFQQGACEVLLRGENPYAASYPNIFPDGRLYGDRVLVDGRVQSFPYPPLSLLLGLPGYQLGGDVRWSLAIVLPLTCLLLVLTGRRLGLPAGHAAELAAIAWLFAPTSFAVLERGWTEPHLALAAALTAWLLACGRRAWTGVALGLLVSAKQYGLLWGPQVWKTGGLRLRDLALAVGVIAVLFVPFLLWDAAAMWRGLVVFQMDQPFRDDALGVPAAVWEHFGVRLPAAVGFAGAGLVLVLMLWRATPGLAGAAFSGAAVFLTFFAFNKWAFANYYWFITTLLSLAVVAAVAQEARAGPQASLAANREAAGG